MLRLRFLIGLVLSLMLGLILCTSLDLEAARRSRRSRASAAQQRQKMIAQLQSQIKSAQNLLKQAESKAGLSTTQLQSAAAQLSQAHRAMEAAKAEEQQARVELKEIEEDILAEQPDGSEYVKTKDLIETKLIDCYTEFFKVTEIDRKTAPKNLTMAKLMMLANDEQQQLLKQSDLFQQAREELHQATAKLDLIKAKLFHEDPEWKQTHDHCLSAADDLHDAQQHGIAAGKDSFAAKQEYKSAQEVAQYAREFIQQAQARIKQVGGSKPSTKK